MTVRKQGNGNWMADVCLDSGQRVRKSFKKKSEALAYEGQVRTKQFDAGVLGSVLSFKDKRRLSQIIELWFIHHGAYLSDPARRHRSLKRLAFALGDPISKSLKPELYLAYRHKRVSEGISPKTLNNELGYLNSVYSHLFQTEQIVYQSPLSKVKPLRIKERELAFLTLGQCQELIDHASMASNPALLLIIRICLQTGARWSEAESLTLSQVGKSRLTFTDTKNGKNRTVPITGALEADLRAFSIGRPKLFYTSIAAFRRLLKKCSFTLPRGQAAHALRHTYASHFMMNGGDILTLQRILGHSNINLTMRYSHLSPGHLSEAVKYRPKVGK